MYRAILLFLVCTAARSYSADAPWVKYAANPVIGGEYGTCFDVAVLRDAGRYRMWLSWRPKKCIALLESEDGLHWTGAPQPVLMPRHEIEWEQEVNRPVVLKQDRTYHMWYTGQGGGRSAIGYATSPDGAHWEHKSNAPVLRPGAAWEKVATMCPHVLWDGRTGLYRMWYSAGEQYEPDSVGYATSRDGVHWSKDSRNPIFRPDANDTWEKHKVTAVQVQRQGDWFVMFYIGFRDVDHAQIGLARSRDGITGWQRNPQNPIIRPTSGGWDADACYKPFAMFDGSKWLLWYNGRRGRLEQIGIALHEGQDLGFGN